MSYSSIAANAEDVAFFKRVQSCAAQEGEGQNPGAWVSAHIWEVCSKGDIEDSYEYALNAENPDPGGDEGVITDQMILSAVQSIMHPPTPMPKEEGTP